MEVSKVREAGDFLLTPDASLDNGITKPTRIEVEAAQPLLVHLNGDLVGQTPAVFEILPKALKLLVAK